MNIFENYLSKINKIILDNKKTLKLKYFKNLYNINLEVPPNHYNYDLSSNVSLVLAKQNKLKPIILANNIKLSIKLNLDGAYLPSFNKSFTHLSYPLKKKFILIGSAHNLKEIRIKEKQKVKEIFLSSLFKNIMFVFRASSTPVLNAFLFEKSSTIK